MNSSSMISVFLLLAVSLVAASAATNRLSAAKKTGPADTAGKLEQEVLDELNLARQKPQEYAKIVEEHRKRFKDGNAFSLPGGMVITTQEGVKAVDEAIAFLKKAKPLAVLNPSFGLSLAARDHVADSGPTGHTGHNGTDGSDPAMRMKRYGDWETLMGENISYGHDNARIIVIQLIVDDGVPSRGHRANIFQPKYKTVGISCGAHKTFRHMCVMDFAGAFRENKATRDAAKKQRP